MGRVAPPAAGAENRAPHDADRPRAGRLLAMKILFWRQVALCDEKVAAR